jgi:hypothetical protein
MTVQLYRIYPAGYRVHPQERIRQFGSRIPGLPFWAFPAAGR